MSDCNDKELWCPDKKTPKKTPKKDKEKEKSTGKDILQLDEKSDSDDPDEPRPETPKKKEPPKKKTLTINDFKEEMRVEWDYHGKVIQGTVDKINKKKKYKLMIIWDNGHIKEVDINKLRII